MKQKIINEKGNKSTITVRDFNSTLSITDRISRLEHNNQPPWPNQQFTEHSIQQ